MTAEPLTAEEAERDVEYALLQIANTTLHKEQGQEIMRLVRRVSEAAAREERGLDDGRPPLPREVVESDTTYMAGLIRGRELEREAREGQGLDVERLARAITYHSLAQRADGPGAYLDHKCMGDCANAIAVEYVHAALSTEPES